MFMEHFNQAIYLSSSIHLAGHIRDVRGIKIETSRPYPPGLDAEGLNAKELNDGPISGWSREKIQVSDEDNSYLICALTSCMTPGGIFTFTYIICKMAMPPKNQ